MFEPPHALFGESLIQKPNIHGSAWSELATVLPKTMKAIIYYGPRDVRVDNIQVPEVASADVLVEVRARGICGTDFKMYLGTIPYVSKVPVIMGHEGSGVVAEIGSAVDRVSVGDRVCINPILSCGECYYCSRGADNMCKKYRSLGMDADGDFAEYVKVPARNVFRLPDRIPFDEGAVLCDALATPLHAVRRAGVVVGETAVVYGVGGLGSCAVQLLRMCGAKVIAVDVVEEKLKLARELGVDETVNSAEEDPVSRVIELTDGEGADVSVEVVGSKETLEPAIKSIRKGGRVIMIGIYPEKIQFDPIADLQSKEAQFLGVWGWSRSDYPAAIELVRSGRVNLRRLISHRIALSEIERAWEIFSKEPKKGRIVIDRV